MPVVEEQIDIKMDPAQLFPIISDFERYPEFMADVQKVTVLERGDGWSTSEWINLAAGRTIKWVEKDFVKPDENRIDFELVKGDLKTFEGFWLLEPNGESAKLTLRISFEFGIPMLAPLLHPLLAKILRENIKQMLTGLKKRAEE